MLVSLGLLFASPAALAQSTPELDKKGFQQNRDYLQLLPFEHFDTLSGNVILTLPQLTLPGNAGRDLTFQLTYNTSRYPGETSDWTFGVAGVPMIIVERPAPSNPGALDGKVLQMWYHTPLIVTSDGERRKTTYKVRPSLSTNDVMTSDFWVYDRAARRLKMPDGTVATYDTNPSTWTRRLVSLVDPFGNETAFAWGTNPELTVTQHLGNGQDREVLFELDGNGLPDTMTYLGRQWDYDVSSGQLIAIQPPIGPAWTFSYGNPAVPDSGRLKTFTTPLGGVVDYVYDAVWYQWGPDPQDRLTVYPMVTRTTNGRQVVGGEWNFAYLFDASAGLVAAATVTLPSGAHVSYDYGPVSNIAGIHPDFLDGGTALTFVTVESPVAGGTYALVEREERQYTPIGVLTHTAANNGTITWGSPEVSKRIITRSDVATGSTRTYTTEYTYSANNFGDYHRPMTTVETGESTRTITRGYTHLTAASGAYVLGLPGNESVAVGAELWSNYRGWTYDAMTGFLKSQTEGTTSVTFYSDERGNVGRMKKGNNRKPRFCGTGHTPDGWGVHRDRGSQSSSIGTANVQAWTVTDVTGTIAPADVVPVSLATPGQTARLTFNGVTGQKYTTSATVTTGAFGCSWSVTILKPDLTPLGGPAQTCNGTSLSLGPLTLLNTGTHTIVVNPASNSTGAANVTLTLVP